MSAIVEMALPSGFADSLSQMPDAFTPTVFAERSIDNSPYRKRAEILARARHLIADEGWQGFSLRKLASKCGVSRQTLHNIAGSRADLVCHAVCDHTVMMHRHVGRIYRSEEYFVGITEHLIKVVASSPSYVRQIIELYHDLDHPLFQMVNKISLKMNWTELSAMQRAGALRDDIDLPALNARIVELHTACMRNWAKGLLNKDEFGSHMRMGCQILLFGAMARREHAS